MLRDLNILLYVFKIILGLNDIYMQVILDLEGRGDIVILSDLFYSVVSGDHPCSVRN